MSRTIEIVESYGTSLRLGRATIEGTHETDVNDLLISKQIDGTLNFSIIQTQRSFWTKLKDLFRQDEIVEAEVELTAYQVSELGDWLLNWLHPMDDLDE